MLGRTLLTAVAVLPLAVGAAAAPSASAQSGLDPFGTPRSMTPQPTERVDRDGDGMYESLERRLAAAAADDPVRVIVALREEASAERVRGLERAVGDFTLGRRFRIIDGFSATVPKRLVARLASQGVVAHVEDDAVVRAQNGGAQMSFGAAAAKLQVPGLDGNADGAASYSTGDLVAAVVDTGIDGGHVALDGDKVLAFRDYVNADGAARAPYDDQGHGTHVAGTVAGDGDGSSGGADRGVAPGAALIGLKTLGADGRGLTSYNVAALDWVVANKAAFSIDVVNMSLGSNGCNPGTDAVAMAVNATHAAGLVVAVAAGNSGPGPCTMNSPGSAADALTVGNMADSTKGGFFQVSSSSRGPTSDGRIKPDVSGPGYLIKSAQANSVSGYFGATGTSMATPFVAGLALLMLERNPGLTPQQVKDTIKSTAIEWGPAGADNEYGSGRLDGYAAISAVGAPLTAPPGSPPHVVRNATIGPGGTVDIPLETVGGVLAVTSIETTPGVNFDIQLLKGNKAPAAAPVNDGRQDTTNEWIFTAGTKRWVRVRSIAGTGSFAVDISGATEAVPDTQPSETTITTSSIEAGQGLSTTTSASFSFTSPDSTATFECSRDGAAYADCISPKSYFDLAQGDHTFEVRAVDEWGNRDATSETRAWKIDSVAPTVTVTAGTQGTVDSTEASFSFTTNDPTATTTCRIDGGTFKACSSPASYSSLFEGPHTFNVRAADPAGNSSVWGTRTWTVDALAPDTAIVYAEPKGLTRMTSASFQFSATEDATFACKLDAGAWTACAPDWDHWWSYRDLGDGEHTLLVRATDKGGKTDATPASHTWTVDTTPPDTTVTSGPSDWVSSATNAFAFSSTEAGSSFECDLKGAGYTACSSPQSYTMPAGWHFFQVRAVDKAGNADMTPAGRSWGVNGPGAVGSPTGGSQTGTTYVPPQGSTSVPPSGYIAPPTGIAGGSTTSASRTAPMLQGTVTAAPQRLANVLRKGLVVKVACSPGCTAAVSVERRGGRRGKALMGMREVMVRSGSVTTTVKLAPSAKRALRKARTATVLLSAVLIDASNNRRTVTGAVKLRR